MALVPWCFLHKHEVNNIVLPIVLILSVVKPHLKLLALAIPYSWKPNEKCNNDFIIGLFY